MPALHSAPAEPTLVHSYTLDDLQDDLLEDRLDVTPWPADLIARVESSPSLELDDLAEFLLHTALKDRRSPVRRFAREALLSLEGNGIVLLAKQLSGTPQGVRLNHLIMGTFNAVV